MKILDSIPEDFRLAESVFDFITFNQIDGYSTSYGIEFIIKGRSSIELYTLQEGQSYDFLKPYLNNKQVYVRK